MNDVVIPESERSRAARPAVSPESLQRRRPRAAESGQALVGFAVVVMGLMSMLTLVVDAGMILGQRRFDQNAADAAALAAARMLGDGVSPRTNAGDVYFTWSDAEVYREVRRYAGLAPSGAGAAPSGLNRHAGFTTRTQLAVTLEYWDGRQWCASPSGPPPPSPAAPACVLPMFAGRAHPPLPQRNEPYKLRVTVSSTTRGFFARIVGAHNTSPTRPGSTGAACLRVPGAEGLTTCARGVASIRGSTVYLGTAPVIPPTTGDCQLVPSAVGSLMQLWGANPNGCGYNIGSWKGLLDLTAERRWCDGLGIDYRYSALMPAAALGIPGGCVQVSADNTWARSGFVADPLWPGSVDPKVDVAYWIARGFGGRLQAGYSDGNRLPTYSNTTSGETGNLGENIAAGFYCGSSAVTATACDTGANPAGTYFFAQNQPDFHRLCPDSFGAQYGVGCRDATVATWTQPEWATGAGTALLGWSATGTGAPDRVRIARLATFRIYCEFTGTGLCTRPPQAIVGSTSNSTVWGRFLAPFVNGRCTTCTAGPSLNGNDVVLES